MIKTYRMLLEMMTPRERVRFWILVIATFFLSVLEAVSVTSILPFLQLLANPDLIETNATLSWLFTTLNFEDTRSFLIWTGAAILAVTVLGLAVKTLAVWLTTHFALMRAYSFSARLLTGYLHQPYEWFLSRHSANLGSSVLSEVDKVVAEALLPAMRIIPDAFTVLLLVGALCIMEPEIALGGAAILGSTYSLIFLTVRNVMTRLGSVRFETNKDRFHVVQEAMGGIKELKIMGLEQGFLHRFRRSALLMARVQTKGQVIMNLPRYALEAVAFGGMILLILVLMVRGDGDISALIPTLGLIAVVGLRMIPALQQLYQRGTSLRQSMAALERIHDDLTSLKIDPEEDRARRERQATLELGEQLELAGIFYGYPETPRPALSDLNITIKAHTTIGIVGGTGAGKTTVIDIILGLLEPSEGTMRVDGVNITRETRRSWQKTLGYVPQTIFLSDGTLSENIAYGVPTDEIDHQAVEAAAKIAALHDVVMSDMPDGYDTMVGERGVRLSGGQRQRVGIARALYGNPSVLILDEATSALDTLTEAAIMEAVERISGQKTIIMIAHRLSTVKHCDCIYHLHNGQIVSQGSFDELVASDDAFRKMAMAGAVLSP